MSRTWEAKSGGWGLLALDERHRGGRAPAPPEVKPEAASTEEEVPRALVCRGCRTAVSAEDAVFSVTEGGAVQVFPNPGGWMRKIITVGWAQNLVGVGEGTTDFTWFAGYAWTAMVCAGCGRHLGWAYDAVGPAEPRRFFGLLVAEVEAG